MEQQEKRKHYRVYHIVKDEDVFSMARERNRERFVCVYV